MTGCEAYVLGYRKRTETGVRHGGGNRGTTEWVSVAEAFCFFWATKEGETMD